MIGKEERAELRELVTSVTLPFPWKAEEATVLSGERDFIAECDEDDEECSEITTLIAAAVNALPKTLDALDAADERIAGLEALRDAHRDARERADAREDALKARIAELEAAAQWRPIEEAPKDGKDWFIVARAGTPLRGPAYWFHGHWCQGNNAELHFAPTHFCELPDDPALPEGGAK